MMKIKDFFCLIAGVALLVLAFQFKGCAETVPCNRTAGPEETAIHMVIKSTNIFFNNKLGSLSSSAV